MNQNPGTYGIVRTDWHASAATEALAAFDSDAEGLSAADAALRRESCGANRLPEAARRSPWMRLLQQFRNLFIYVLLAAALIALLLGHPVDAIVILAVVFINAAIGFVQEGRAEQALDAIRAMIDPRAIVIRDGHRLTIPAEDIVPGDIVVLEAGDRVPADLRLLRQRSLRIAEAALTGESVAVEKHVDPVAPDAPLGDRQSMAYSGTLVTGGQGIGVAVATGAATELGRISALLEEVGRLETPLTRQMDRFARALTLVIIAVCVLVFAWAYLRHGYGLAAAFMVVVGLAVAAIPEGLPAILTITLAIGVGRMARRNAIVRRLPAVETLGSVSVICSDKTGTLTRNEMMVAGVVTADDACTVTGTGYEPVGRFLCGQSKSNRGTGRRSMRWPARRCSATMPSCATAKASGRSTAIRWKRRWWRSGSRLAMRPTGCGANCRVTMRSRSTPPTASWRHCTTITRAKRSP
jgi:magnesium-transporting ATPase (P-type)